MSRKILSLAVTLILSVVIVLDQLAPASAKLGERFGPFQIRIVPNFKFQGQSNKGKRKYFMYTMILDKATEHAAPGFQGGLTVSVEDGVIVGQSMLLRLGDNADAGKALAAVHALDFTFESLGRPAPPSRMAAAEELKSYAEAVDNALSGTPQNIRYPGSPGKITLCRQEDGSLAIAATLK